MQASSFGKIFCWVFQNITPKQIAGSPAVNQKIPDKIQSFAELFKIIYLCLLFSCRYNFLMEQYETDFFGRWIGISAHRLSHLVSRTLQKEGFDLTHEQLVLLMIISREKGISQIELAKKLDRDKTSITRSISKLEKNHKLVRLQTAKDKRVNNLYLTKEGSQLLNDLMPVVKAIRAELKNGFDQKEIDLVVSFLKRLTGRVVEMENKL